MPRFGSVRSAMRVFGLPRRSRDDTARLGAPGSAPSWAAGEAWRAEWEAPRNWIHSEGEQIATLAALTGPPSARGYLIPVDVMLEREPRNPDDPDAVRAYVGGRHVGYLARSIAAQVSPAMAEAETMRIIVPGVVRGGRLTASHVGVHIWFGRGADRISVYDDGGRVSWPPAIDEGDP
jgi:hypothetical protein